MNGFDICIFSLLFTLFELFGFLCTLLNCSKLRQTPQGPLNCLGSANQNFIIEFLVLMLACSLFESAVKIMCAYTETHALAVQ